MIRLLGKPTVEGVPDHLATNPLLLCLGAHHPALISRSELGSSTIEAFDTPAGANRFRVALARLRKLVPIIEHEGSLGFDLERVIVDVAEVRSAINSAVDEPDALRERAILESFLPHLSLPLLEGVDVLWSRDAAQQWTIEATAALQRLGAIGDEVDDWELALRAAQAGLAHLPDDESFWEIYLRAMVRLGREAEALRRFNGARRRLLSEREDFSPELVELAHALPAMAERAGYSLSSEEEGILLGFARRCFDSEPEVALQLLASNSFRPELIRRPAAFLRLCEPLLARDFEPCDALERVRVRRITASALLRRDDRVIELAEEFLAQPVQPARRRIALLNVSFSYCAKGRYEDALRSIDEAIEIAVKTDSHFDAYQCRAQRAALRMLMGESEALIPDYREALDYFEQHPNEGSEVDTLSIRCNLAKVLLDVDDVEGAHREASSADQRARTLGSLELEALSASTMGLVFAKQNKVEESKSALRRALRAGYRAGPSMAITVLGRTYDALAMMGNPSAAKVLADWTELFTESGAWPHRDDAARLSRTSGDVDEVGTDLLGAIRRACQMLRADPARLSAIE